jgi:CO dehydrogenase maturation factor
MDMEAGLEHLGRGTIKGVDALLNVVEPRSQSITISSRIANLATELGVQTVLAVGNKVANHADETFLKEETARLGIEPIAMVPFDEKIAEADRARIAPLDFAPESPANQAVRELEAYLRKTIT